MNPEGGPQPKDELQKCKETISQLAFIVMASTLCFE